MSRKVTFSNLEIEIIEGLNDVLYRFTGDVNENFRHQEVPRVKKDQIIFELDKVENFNSIGIREWIYLVKDLGKMGSLEFRKCSVTVIDQINMVPDSLGGGVIESFFAPYYCANHGEVNQFIKVKDALTDLSNRVAPSLKCEQCGNDLEFDALEESYFLFAGTGLKSVS